MTNSRMDHPAINYDGRLFRGVSNSDSGEVSSETLFRYHQDGDVLSGDYAGGDVRIGHLLGLVHNDGSLEFTYHHINVCGELMAGRCESRVRHEDGRLMLDERWQWLTGNQDHGTSVVMEVDE